MYWQDILVLIGLFGVAGWIFYRAYKKKKWCPAVFGSNKKDNSSD